MPTTSVEINVGSSSWLETSVYPSSINVLACADLPAHDDRVLDFSKDKSSFLGPVDADVHAGTITNVSKDAECLVDESLSLGLVTAEMHTETTARDDDRVVESPASGFSTDLAGVNADVHIWTTVKTDAISASSVDECWICCSPVLDAEFTGFAVSDVLSPCCSVFGSLSPNIFFFYSWHSESAVYANLGLGSLVSWSLALHIPVYALKSAVVAGLGFLLFYKLQSSPQLSSK